MEHRAIRNRWKVFAQYLVSGLSATEAYLRAGYRCTTRFSAQAASSRLRHRPDVSAFIRRLTTLAARAARRRAVRLLRGKLSHLARVIATSADHILDSDLDLATRRVFKNGSVTTRLPCKLTALHRYAELAGYFPSLSFLNGPENTKNPHQTITFGFTA